jgi:hypothetical protein
MIIVSLGNIPVILRKIINVSGGQPILGDYGALLILRPSNSKV